MMRICVLDAINAVLTVSKDHHLSQTYDLHLHY